MTVRAEARRADIDTREQVNVPDRLVRGDAPGDFGDVRRHLGFGQESLLFDPVLRGRSGDRLLAKHDPPGVDLVDLRELPLRVPSAFLRVEVVALEVTDLEERHGAVGSGDEHVAVVATPLEHFL